MISFRDRRRGAASGFHLTAIAAGLVVLVGLVSAISGDASPFGSHRAGPIATVVGTLVAAGALLDRWRPMRWLARVTSAIAAVGYTFAAVMGEGTPWREGLMAATLVTVVTILGLARVRRWFSRTPNEWGDDEEPEGAPSPMLPVEKVEPGIPGVQRGGGDSVSAEREARSNRSPEERK